MNKQAFDWSLKVADKIDDFRKGTLRDTITRVADLSDLALNYAGEFDGWLAEVAEEVRSEATAKRSEAVWGEATDKPKSSKEKTDKFGRTDQGSKGPHLHFDEQTPWGYTVPSGPKSPVDNEGEYGPTYKPNLGKSNEDRIREALDGVISDFKQRRQAQGGVENEVVKEVTNMLKGLFPKPKE